MTTKTTKTILFASLIAALILPFSMVDFAEASEISDKDLILIKEADEILKKQTQVNFDSEGNLDKETKSHEDVRLEQIIKQLNAKGMFHISQERDESLKGYEVQSEKTIESNGHTIESVMFSPVGSSVETMDSVCCGGSHDKKLSIRSGMEWPNSVFPWIIHREVGPWSAMSSTFGASTSQINGNENDVTMYFHTKNDHPITTATYTVTSDLLIKDIHGNWISLQPSTSITYYNVYYSIINTLKGASMYDESWLPGPTRHVTSMSISSIS